MSMSMHLIHASPHTYILPTHIHTLPMPCYVLQWLWWSSASTLPQIPLLHSLIYSRNSINKGNDVFLKLWRLLINIKCEVSVIQFRSKRSSNCTFPSGWSHTSWLHGHCQHVFGSFMILRIIEFNFTIVIRIFTLSNFVYVSFGHKYDNTHWIIDSTGHLVDNVMLHHFLVKPCIDSMAPQGVIDLTHCWMIISAEFIHSPVMR